MSGFNEQDFIKAFESCRPGKSFYAYGVLYEINEVLGRIGPADVLDVDGEGKWLVTKPSNRKSAKRSEILDLLGSYRFGLAPVSSGINYGYLRSVVSVYNAATGSAFRVKKKDGMMYIFKDPKDCAFIRESDFVAIRNGLLAELDRLTAKVRPDDFEWFSGGSGAVKIETEGYDQNNPEGEELL